MSTVQLNTSYTQQVKDLLLTFYDPKKRAPCIVGDATLFFASYNANLSKREEIVNTINASTSEVQVRNAKEKLSSFDSKMTQQRTERYNRLDDFIVRLLSLTEGSTKSETLNATSKFLGTLLLITDRSNNKFAQQHKVLKPLYKAALTLRLTDSLLAHGETQHNYLGKFIDSQLRFKNNKHWQEKWRTELAIPIVKAALLQDIGLYHPYSLELLIGQDNTLDEFRLLNELDRKRLLKLNLQYSLAYLKKGLGIPAIKADSHQEKEKKLYVLEQALQFSLETVQDATILKNHIGDLIKIPQIYTSFVLSTKSNYTMKDVPKGYMVIEQLMKNGTLDSNVANCFLKMTGYFPQGFGVCYIAFDAQGNVKENYELAIVNSLYPKSPAEPNARPVTRHLTYITSGKDLTIKRNDNLYFQSNHKKLQPIDPERLKEILAQLSGGNTATKAEDLVPQFWEPFEFFTQKRNQNLWSRN